MMTKKKYDFLVVGAGLFGSVFAHEANKKGLSCLVLDRREHIGGNTYCKNVEGINVHYYGAHIFHTNNKFIWDYVNSFVEFNRYTNSPVAISNEKLYNLPFNMNTFHQIWGVTKPEDAVKIIDQQTKKYGVNTPKNLEEQALSLVGKDIYEILIKEYTEKQWGRKATELPAFIIKRLPLRFNYDNNYFNDKYQGIPIGGYNALTEKLLEGIETRLNTDFFNHKAELLEKASKVIYTGKIDQFFDYKFGELEYRSLKFDHKVLNLKNFQGNAVVNYIDRKYDFTRIIEHKHFEFGTQKNTVITKEFPIEATTKNEPYYPINDSKNNLIFKKYKALSKGEKNIYFGGRLAEYRYYDMHQIIASALTLCKKIL